MLHSERIPTIVIYGPPAGSWVRKLWDRDASESSKKLRGCSSNSIWHSMCVGDFEMTTARELWEQNRNDPLVKKLNDGLSKNSESSAPSSSPSASESSGTNSTQTEVLFGMSPKRVQSLNPKLEK